MTAGVIIVGNNGIETFTDGGAFDADGNLGQYSNKVRVLPHISALVFCRGSGSACEYAKTMCQHFTSFDNLISGMAGIALLVSKRAQQVDNDPINLSMVIAGYSDEYKEWQAHQVAVVANDLGLMEGSLTVSKLPWFYAEPWPDDEILAASSLYKDGEFQWNSTIQDGIDFLHCQRDTVYVMHPDSDLKGCVVGGFIEHTVLTHDRAQQAIIHRWPDRLWEKMNSKKTAS